MDNKTLALRLIQASNERGHNGFTVMELCNESIEMFIALENNNKSILNGQLELLEEDNLTKKNDFTEELIEELKKRLGK